MNERLISEFRKLRVQAYFREEHDFGPEREWETAEREAYREEQNRKRREAWNAETEAIIRGDAAPEAE